MASFVYHKTLKKLLDGDFDLSADTFMMAIVMTNTTADTETDIEFLSGFSTLDEFDGTGYTASFAGRPVLDSTTVNEDLANDRAEFDGDDETLTTLGNGTRQVEGFVIARKVTSDADSEPFIFIDTTSFDPDSLDLLISWNAEGILQLANA